MKKYIAYFDYLGYKELIFNNDSEYLRKRAGHILRDIELALGQGKYQEPSDGVILADLSTSRINCLNISDTVIFWTSDDSLESLEELLIVAHHFNWQEILFNIPVRGCIYYDEFEMISGKSRNTVGAIYSANLIYGKGLASAHMKVENLNWAGTVIDITVIDQISKLRDVKVFLKPFAKLYKVPYKKMQINQPEEYVMNIFMSNLNETAYKNEKKNILRSFSGDNKKSIDNSPRVQEILANTIAFLDTYRDYIA